MQKERETTSCGARRPRFLVGPGKKTIERATRKKKKKKISSAKEKAR